MTTETKAATFTDLELSEMNIAALRKLARQSGNSGNWVNGLTKNELITLLTDGAKAGQTVPRETVDLEKIEKENAAIKAKYEAKKVEPSNGKSDDLVKMIADAVQSHIKAPEMEMDEDAVRKVVDSKMKVFTDAMETAIDEMKKAQVKNITVTLPDGTKKAIGKQHKKFNTVLKMASSAKINTWLYGDAGSGKTYLAKAVSKALGLEFYAQSVTAQTTKSDLFGYMDANGNYVPSLFYKAFTEGALFCLDEVDNGNANVLNLLNSATSNGEAGFPCGMRTKHEKFRLIACANTIGDGASRKFVGRNALDFANKDRFCFEKLDTDWDLIKNIVAILYGSGILGFYERAMKARKEIEKLGLTNIQVTSRTVINGAELIYSCGVEEKDVWDKVLFKGCDESSRKKIMEVIKTS